MYWIGLHTGAGLVLVVLAVAVLVALAAGVLLMYYLTDPAVLQTALSVIYSFTH